MSELPHKRIGIFGYQRSAVEVAAYLKSREYSILIVDDDEEQLAKARYLGYDTAKLDFRDDAELKKIRLGEDIDVLFSLFPDDAENVFLTISARALAPKLRIITIAHDPDSVPKLRAAGADKVIDSHEIAGRRIWHLLTRPIVTEILDHTLFGKANLNLVEVPIPTGSKFEGRQLCAICKDFPYNLILLGVVDRDAGERFIFSIEGRDHVIDSEDILVVIGPDEEIDRLRRDIGA